MSGTIGHFTAITNIKFEKTYIKHDVADYYAFNTTMVGHIISFLLKIYIILMRLGSSS